MATAVRRERWDHTCGIVAAILNSRSGIKRHQFVDANRLNPYRKTPRRVLDREESRTALRNLVGAAKR